MASSRTPASVWLAYAGAGLAVMVAIVAIAAWLAPADDARAILLAAALAYAIQLIAFALLVALRGKAELFMAAWLGGMVLRFAALGGCAYWLSRTSALPRGTTLLSFVAFVFLMLLLEPVFLRRDLRGP